MTLRLAYGFCDGYGFDAVEYLAADEYEHWRQFIYWRVHTSSIKAVGTIWTEWKWLRLYFKEQLSRSINEVVGKKVLALC